MSDSKPIIAITMGDPASIGPEVALKALGEEAVYTWCRPLIVGDAGVLEHFRSLLELGTGIRPVSEVAAARFEPGTIDVYDLKNVTPGGLRLGEISAMAGKAAFETVVKTIELAMDGQVQATVTGPINKKSIHEAGHFFSGHTEIYAHYTGTAKYAMLLVEEDFRVIHVSTHVSLREACDRVTRDRVLEVIILMDQGLRQLGVSSRKIGVAGLNPHAGDSGLFGHEEEKEIVPAIDEALRQGYDVEGPVPADTMFSKAVTGYYDGCVAMYHDQGHIPFKLSGFKWNNETRKMDSVKGVNITLGLPIIRTSVDHGTAFDIAGRNIASPDAMLLAIKYAAQLARNRKNTR